MANCNLTYALGRELVEAVTSRERREREGQRDEREGGERDEAEVEVRREREEGGCVERVCVWGNMFGEAVEREMKACSIFNLNPHS